MTRQTKALAGLIFVVAAIAFGAATACGGSDTSGSDDLGDSGGSTSAGGGSSTGGSSTGANPAAKFAGTWQASNWVSGGTCAPQSEETPPWELVAGTDGTLTFISYGCTYKFSVSGNVAELVDHTPCNGASFQTFRIELTSETQATVTGKGTVTGPSVNCTTDSTATLTRISTEAQP